MSRHEFMFPDGRTLAVGWDNPLETYFFQSSVPRRPSSRVWHGTAARELPDIASLEAKLAECAFDLSRLSSAGIGVAWTTVRERLIADRARASAPTPLQLAMRR